MESNTFGLEQLAQTALDDAFAADCVLSYQSASKEFEHFMQSLA